MGSKGKRSRNKASVGEPADGSLRCILSYHKNFVCHKHCTHSHSIHTFTSEYVLCVSHIMHIIFLYLIYMRETVFVIHTPTHIRSCMKSSESTETRSYSAPNFTPLAHNSIQLMHIESWRINITYRVIYSHYIHTQLHERWISWFLASLKVAANCEIVGRVNCKTHWPYFSGCGTPYLLNVYIA